MTNPPAVTPRDSLTRNFRIAVVGVVLYILILYLAVGRGPILPAFPVFEALAEILAMLSALAIAFLAYTRYRTLGEPATFAIAVAFWGTAIFSAFVAVTLPSLPVGPGLFITVSSNVVTWLEVFRWTSLALGLLASLLAPVVAPPGVRGRRFYGVIALTGVASVAIAVLTIALNGALPLLSVDGDYLTPFEIWMSLLAIAFAIMGFLSSRRYGQVQNPILGQVAVLQLAVAAILAGQAIGGHRFSIWWYLNQFWLVGGYVGVLFGLLSGYVNLFELERARARQLAALDAITEVGLSTLNTDTLLRSLLDRLVRELGGTYGAALLLNPETNTLAVRAVSGLPEGRAESIQIRPGEGFVGQAFESADLVVLSDHQVIDSRIMPALHPPGVQAILAAPMRQNTRPIGVLYIDFVRPRGFADWELNLMRLAADRAATALERARLYEETRRREAQARLLAEAGRLFGSTLQFDTILHTVVEQTATVLNSTCMVFLRQDDRLVPEASASSQPERLAAIRHVLAETQLRVGEGLLGKVAASGQPVLVADIRNTGEPVHDVQAVLPFDVGSVVVAPLASRGIVFGVLVVAMPRGPRRLDEDDLRLISELARRAATALDISRLYQDIVRDRDFLDTVLRSLPTPIAVFEGPDLIYRRANHALQELVGENVPIVGRKLTDVFPTTAYDGTAALLRRAVETDQPIHVTDYEFAGLPRGVTYWNLSLVPLKHETGRPPSILMLAADTTTEVQTRHRVEELARESGQRASVLRAVLDSVDEGILMVDTSGDVILANRTLSQLFNLGPGFFQGRVRSEAVFGWMRQRALDPGTFAAREEYLSAHPEVEAHDEVELAVPTRRIFLRYSSPVRDSNGNLIGRIEVYRDVTEQRRRERERDAISNAARDLVEEMEMSAVARTVAENAIGALGGQASAVWLASPERHELRLISSRNLSPVSVDELRTESFDAATIEAAAARSQQPIVIRRIEDAGASIEHTRLIAQTEGLRSLVATPLIERGKLVGILLVGWTTPQELPTTELHLAQTLSDLFALALDNARLYESVKHEVQLREEFLAAAAHELKTPLTSLRGYSQLLLRRRKEEADGERRALAAIDRSARRIAHLGDELLEALNLRRRPPPVEITSFDLTALVGEGISAWKEAGHTNPVRFVTAQPIEVKSDRGLVRLIVEHLLDNAARRSPERVPIDVNLQRIDNRAIVRVRDYGPGIPEERQPHLFEPLYEAHPPGTAGYVGLVGLELYLSRQIVQRLNGDIWFESVPGAGAVVAFSLPLAPAEGEKPSAAGAKPQSTPPTPPPPTAGPSQSPAVPPPPCQTGGGAPTSGESLQPPAAPPGGAAQPPPPGGPAGAENEAEPDGDAPQNA